MAGGVILPYGSTATAADVGSMDPARARRRTLALAGLLVAAACVAAVGLIAPAPGTDALEVRLTRRACAPVSTGGQGPRGLGGLAFRVRGVRANAPRGFCADHAGVGGAPRDSSSFCLIMCHGRASWRPRRSP